MMYTIGHKEIMDANLFMNDGNCLYAAPIVFETFIMAQRYIDGSPLLEHYAVYQLEGDWDLDTLQRVGEPFRRIKAPAYVKHVDAKLRQLLDYQEANASIPVPYHPDLLLMLWRRFNSVATALENVKTLPVPADLYYPVKNEPGTGWNYRVSGLGVGDIREVADILRNFIKL